MEVIWTSKYGHALKPLKFIGRNLSHRKKVELKNIDKIFKLQILTNTLIK